MKEFGSWLLAWPVIIIMIVIGKSEPNRATEVVLVLLSFALELMWLSTLASLVMVLMSLF